VNIVSDTGESHLRMGQQFHGSVQYPQAPGVSRSSKLVGFRAGLNEPRRKPVGHAADRNICTLRSLAPVRNSRKRLLLAEARAARLIRRCVHNTSLRSACPRCRVEFSRLYGLPFEFRYLQFAIGELWMGKAE
jgi:hypothetical protein